MNVSPLQLCLLFSSALFCVGLIGALSRSNTILVLLGIELMLNAANLNFIAFWRYGASPAPATGVIFVIFSTVASGVRGWSFPWGLFMASPWAWGWRVAWGSASHGAWRSDAASALGSGAASASGWGVGWAWAQASGSRSSTSG